MRINFIRKIILNKNIVSNNLLVISWSLEPLAHMSNSYMLVSPHCTKVLYSKWLCSSSQAPWERICNQQGHDPWVWIHGNRAFEDMAPPLAFPPLGHHLQWAIFGLFGFADWVMRKTCSQHQPIIYLIILIYYISVNIYLYHMLRKQNTMSIKHFSSCVNLWMYPVRLTVRRKYT